MLLAFIISLITYSLAKTISSINNFYCYTDYSIADKPFNFLPKSSRIFEITCGCQHEWKKTFCNNFKRYGKMKTGHSPHVCICRQINDKDSTCDQFMTRCFGDKITKYQSCSCCFNQPDDHCNQLECKNLEPDFGRGSNTSCICHDQSNYPKHICDNEDISPRKKLRPLYTVTGKPYYGITDGTSGFTITDSDNPENSEFYKTILKAVQTNKLILAFIIILIIGVLAAIIFGCCIICFGKKQSNRRTNTRREKRAVNEKRLLEITQNDIEGYLP
uniref:Uncharacterized protein n=1 Tax=Panagrolaimus superbus TaxID=310955 RepID=A0A914XXZ1_9BILA